MPKSSIAMSSMGVSAFEAGYASGDKGSGTKKRYELGTDYINEL